jgi:hypothetical protein
MAINWPITFDGVHLATGSKDAPELAYRAFRIIHVEEGISCGQPIQRFVRQRQNRSITLVCGHSVSNAGCVRVFSRLRGKV